MPHPGNKVVKKPQPKVTDSKGLTWDVEASIDSCSYRLGKLRLGKSVVGEITVLKTEFLRMSSVLSQLGINVRVDE